MHDSDGRVGVDRTDEWRRRAATEPLAGESHVVVGGGVGGLAAACYLAAAGADVEVIERNDRLGGVANRLTADGFTFDTGPSWYLMPDAFERFFEHFGRRPGEFYDLVHLDPHYRLLWKGDGEGPADRLDATGDVDRMAGVFESYEAGAGDAFRDYLAEAAHSYEVGMERFVYEDRPRLRDYLDLDVARSARGLSLLGSMQDHVAGYVDHPKLQQVLQYTLVFLGGAPHNTPALYNLMSHVDFELGVHYPEGGMYSVVEALVDLGADLGVEYTTGTPVTSLAPADDGVRWRTEARQGVADRVLANANPAHVDRDLLADRHRAHPEGYWQNRTYAPSAFMLYLGVEGDVDPLAHHTIVLPDDWDPHFETIFEDPAWPDDPAYYVNVPSRTDEGAAPDGCHAVVVLVPVAPGLQDDDQVRSWYREKTLADLADHAGVELRDRIVVERTASVSEFATRFDAPQGTALGLAHTLRQTGPFRPGRRGPFEGLYYVGAYATPGIGVPMCLVSGEHAAAAAVDDATGRDTVTDRLRRLVP